MARKVIKGEGQHSPAPASGPALADRKVIDRAVFKAQQKVDRIKAAAEEKAEQRRARGQAEAQAAHDAAYQIGAAEGMSAAAGLAIAGYFRRGEALRQATDDCVYIALQICQKVVGRPLELGDVEQRTIAEEILTRAIERRKLSVAFAEDDWATLQRERELLLGAFSGSPELELGADTAAQTGLVTLRLPDGEFNATLEGVVRAMSEVFGVPEGPPLSAVSAAEVAAPSEELARDDAGSPAELDEEEEDGELDIYGEGDVEPALAEEPSFVEEPSFAEQPSLAEEPSFVEEPATYHDIADLVAEIDAEDD